LSSSLFQGSAFQLASDGPENNPARKNQEKHQNNSIPSTVLEADVNASPNN